MQRHPDRPFPTIAQTPDPASAPTREGPTPARPGRRQRTAGRPADADLDARTEALLQASARLFLTEGFTSASYEKIAREACVSTKTIYAWFGGKAGLFEAVMRRLSARIEPVIRAVLDDHRGEPRQTLTEVARMILSFQLEQDNLGLHRAVIAASRDLPEIGTAYYSLGLGRGVEVLAAYLRREDVGAVLAIDDPIASAQAFFGLLGCGLLNRHLLGAETGTASPEDIDLQVNRAVGMFVRAHRS